MRNLKRALSLALASVMLLGMMVVGTNAGYADVDKNDNVEAIEVMKLVGVMTGDDKGNFNPDQVVTRNEMAVVICNLLGLKANDFKDVKLPFTDVAAWAQPYVAAILSRNITAGTSATTFGGEGQVTVLQASLMMMKALGYFQNQGDFQPSWELATATQASSLKLLKGVEGAANSGMTRNEVAQLGLNTLNTNHVKFTGTLGSDIKLPDGTTINTGYNARYEDAVVNGETLAQKLYGNDYSVTKGAKDDYGRPAVTYSYKNKSVTVAQTGDLTFTDQVKDKAALAKLLGVKGNDIDRVYYYENNDNVTDIITSTSDGKIGMNGADNLVVFDKDSKNASVYTVKTMIAEVASVKKADNNSKRSITLNGKSFETELFAKGDMVLYTQGTDNEIKTVVPAEKLTGKLTKIVGNDVYIDGVKYNMASSTRANSVAHGMTASNIGSTVEYYLVNGYIIKIDVTEEAVNLDNLAYVVNAGVDSSRGENTNWATLIFADGTKKTVDTKENYSTSLKEKVVTFKVNKNGQYELKNEATMTGKVTVAANTGYKNTTPKMGNTDLDAETVFVVKVADKDAKVYTGFKAVPEIKKDTGVSFDMASYTKDSGKPADLVYVFVANESDLVKESLEKTIFVAAKGTEALTQEKIGDDEVKYYQYNAVVDGTVTTIKVADTEPLTGSAFITSYTMGDHDVMEGLVKLTHDTTAANNKLDVIAAQADHTAKVSTGAGVLTVEDWTTTKVSTTSYSYADNAVVYVVNADNEIEIVAVADIIEGDYASVRVQVEKGTMSAVTIVLTEK